MKTLITMLMLAISVSLFSQDCKSQIKTGTYYFNEIYTYINPDRNSDKRTTYAFFEQDTLDIGGGTEIAYNKIPIELTMVGSQVGEIVFVHEGHGKLTVGFDLSTDWWGDNIGKANVFDSKGNKVSWNMEYDEKTCEFEEFQYFIWYPSGCTIATTYRIKK